MSFYNMYVLKGEEKKQKQKGGRFGWAERGPWNPEYYPSTPPVLTKKACQDV